MPNEKPSKIPPPLASPKLPIQPDLEKEPTTGAYEIATAIPKRGRRWFPSPAQVIFLSMLAGGTVSLIDVMWEDVISFKHAGLAFTKGALLAFTTYLGMRSAGPKP